MKFNDALKKLNSSSSKKKNSFIVQSVNIFNNKIWSYDNHYTRAYLKEYIFIVGKF